LRAAFRSRRSRLKEGDVHVLNRKRGKKYKTSKGCRKYRKLVGRTESIIFIASRTSPDVNPIILRYIADKEMPVAALIVARKVVNEKPVVALMVPRKLLVLTTFAPTPIFSSLLLEASVDINIGKVGWTVYFSGRLCIIFLRTEKRTNVDGSNAKTEKAEVDIKISESIFIVERCLIRFKLLFQVTGIDKNDHYFLSKKLYA